MPDLSNLSELLPFLLSVTGQALYAMWLRKTLGYLRDPDWQEYKNNPYLEKLSEWVQKLTSIQMYNLAVIAFFVPLIIASVVLYFVPAELLLTVQPYIAAIISSVLVFAGQQWFFNRSQL